MLVLLGGVVVFGLVSLFCAWRFGKLFGQIRIWQALFGAVFLAQVCFALNLRLHFLPREVSIFATILVGLSLFVFCLLLAFEALSFLLRLALKGATYPPKTLRLAKRGAGVSLLLATALLGGYSFYNAFNIKIVKTAFNFNLASNSNLTTPLRFAVISDLHIGGFVTQDFVAKVAEKIRRHNAEAILLVGDISDVSPQQMASSLAPLTALQTPIFAVVGNHEYYKDDLGERILALNKIGIKVLQNEAVEFGGVNLIGVYDLAANRQNLPVAANSRFKPDFDAAYNSVSNPALPTILLAHQPKAAKFLTVAQKKATNLMLSGHTHNGQIFPFNIIAKLANGYLYGLYKEGDFAVFVTSGVGFWGPPFRFGSQSEIVLLDIF